MIRNDVGVNLSWPCISFMAQLILDHVVRSHYNLIIHMVNVRTLAFLFVASTFQFPVRISIQISKKSHTASTSYVLVIYTDEQNYRPLRY